MKKIIILSIALLAGFLTAAAQNNFATPGVLKKQAVSGQDWWEPDTVYLYYWDNNSWICHDAFSYTYDSNNNVLSKADLMWKNNSWVIGNYQTNYTYDSNNNILTELAQMWSNNSWEHFYILQFAYTYDSNNNILTKTQQDGAVSIYTYDSSNNILTEINKKWINNSWINYYQLTYTYDSNNNLLTLLQQKWENNSWINEYQRANTYDSYNNLLSQLLQNWEDNSWKNSLFITYFVTTQVNKIRLSSDSSKIIKNGRLIVK